MGQILWNSTPSVLNLNSGALLHGSWSLQAPGEIPLRCNCFPYKKMDIGMDNHAEFLLRNIKEHHHKMHLSRPLTFNWIRAVMISWQSQSPWWTCSNLHHSDRGAWILAESKLTGVTLFKLSYSSLTLYNHENIENSSRGFLSKKLEQRQANSTEIAYIKWLINLPCKHYHFTIFEKKIIICWGNIADVFITQFQSKHPLEDKINIGKV